jgi:hypothetical protein
VQVKLTAIWLADRTQDAPPDQLWWEDGRVGTLEEFLAHRDDTHRLVCRDDGGKEMHIFTEIVATAYFCPFGRVWGVRGDAVESASLPLDDPDATDNQIQIALMSLPMRYRARIER